MKTKRSGWVYVYAKDDQVLLRKTKLVGSITKSWKLICITQWEENQ